MSAPWRKPSRHEKWYLEDGSIFLKITPEEVIYRLHASLLSLRSGVFKNLLELPMSNLEEGKSDETPIILGQVFRADFDALLAYLFGGWHPEHTDTLESLISILKLATFYEIEEGRNYAISRLRSLPAISPSLQLHLAHQYRIDDWAEQAFRQTLSLPLLSLTAEDAAFLGPHVMWILTRTHLKIDYERRVIAFQPPRVIADSSCTTSLYCHTAFGQEWWSGFAKNYLHPDTPITGREMLDRLESVKIAGVCDGCFSLVCRFIRDSGVLLRDQVIVEQAVQEFMDWQTDKQIRAAMHASV